MPNLPDESIAAKVDSETKRRLRITAAEQGMSMSEYIRIAVKEKLERDSEEGNSNPQMATAD